MGKLSFHHLLMLGVSYALNRVPLCKQLMLVRTMFKMSQASLAKALQCDQASLSVIESGKRNPNIKQFERIAQALGLQIVVVPVQMIPFLLQVLRQFYIEQGAKAKQTKTPGKRKKRS